MMKATVSVFRVAIFCVKWDNFGLVGITLAQILKVLISYAAVQ